MQFFSGLTIKKLKYGGIMEVSQFEDIINKIDGIIKSKIIIENDEIIEIHVLASNSRSAKQFSRDIESAILAAFNYRIDRKVISIAQIEMDVANDSKRIKLDGISYNTLDFSAEYTVKLAYEDKNYEVTKTGIRTSSKRKKLIAEATLNAVEKALGRGCMFDVQDVIEITRGEVTFINVLVNMLEDGKEEFLIGSAQVKNDENEAIAKAALDAVNRRIQKLDN